MCTSEEMYTSKMYFIHWVTGST